MTEEEIMEQIKNDLNVGEFYGITEEAIQGLLDLYNKQKEEIKALELIHETYKEEMKSIEDRYISKDKIRDMIKEIGTYTFDSEEEIKKFDYCIYILKELLEE